MELREVPLVTSVEEAIPHIERWGEMECSPVVTLRLPNACEALNVGGLYALSRADCAVTKLKAVSPLIVHIYESVFGLSPAQSNRLATGHSIGPHIDQSAGSPQAHVNLTKVSRSVKACTIKGHERKTASRWNKNIGKAAHELHLRGPIYEGPLEEGDICLMTACLHHFTLPDLNHARAEAVRVSQMDPGANKNYSI